MTTQSIGTTLTTHLSPTELQISQQSGHIKMMNTSGKRIVFGVSTALKKATTTPTGVLDPNEAALFIVKCDGKEQNDRVTIIYTIPPEGSDKQYRSEYFLREDALIVRKNLPNRFEKITAVLARFEKVINGVSDIAEKYSNWALGKSNYQFSPPSSNYQITQVQTPPRSYNTAPVKRFFHQVRVQPPSPNPKPISYPHSEVSYSPHPVNSQFYSTTPAPKFNTDFTFLPNPYYANPTNVTSSPYYYQQVPPPARISQLPTENRQVFRSPVRVQQPTISMNPNFPRLMETEVPTPTPPMFSTNSSSFPNHMTHNFGPSILSQLLNPILQESSTPTPPIQIAPQIHGNPNFPTLSPLPLPPIQEPPKEEVMKIASKKRLFGMPRFPVDHRNFFQSGMTCISGWCGNECCESRRQFSSPTTTIQATAMPGSPGPPHPLVLVVHPSPPIQQQCSPACQPHCNQQCVARLQYMHETNFYYNHILEPTCRPDCMPSCHVDCLIIPPQQVRCNSFNCQCLAGYVQCAAFTCCMRYPNLAARMRSNVLRKSSEETEVENSDEENVINEKRMYTPIRMRAEKRKHDIENVTQKPKQTFWTKKRISDGKSTSTPTTTSSTTTPPPCPTTTTTTTTTTTPPNTTTTPSTTTTTTPAPTTTTTERTTPMTTTMYSTTFTTSTTTTTPVPISKTTTPKIMMNLTPIYPDMIMKANKIPMIPAYGMWAIPQTSQLPSTPTDEYGNALSGTKTEAVEKKNSVGDIRGRHVIRSENFLDVLSELAQVKIKEDITDDFSHAANFIEFMTDSIRKL
ncbi:hypothetical protein L3Y34_008369 [Caenorhabditis briggsae]|uniref:Major sperm protein n=1 Tax=Caenorhabditis briggsae TaxID=6238 RepID=A0AAE9A928_CAEBR|nr:hypothetical protein L3Y34_008369 [Caenorhabditis briggsae]